MAVGTEKKLKVVSRTRGRASRKQPAGPKRAGKGVKSLRKAADKTVEKHSDKLADSLLNNALAGNLKSAELLVSLAEAETEQEEAGESWNLWSVALGLAEEPEWREEVTEESAETGHGSREPES